MTNDPAVSGAPDANEIGVPEIDVSTITVREMVNRGYVETETHVTYDLHIYVPHELDGDLCRALTSDELANRSPDHEPAAITHALHVVRVTLPKLSVYDLVRLSGRLTVEDSIASPPHQTST